MRLQILVLGSVLLVTLVEAGYYKVRPPPPPPPPPASLHYGPHPPPPHYHGSHHHPPHHHHQHYPHHYSRKPHIHHHPPVRDFHRSPPYPPKPTYIPWKNPDSFRAPVVKETFNPPPPVFGPGFLRDDDRGPIHTIPAPDLTLLDRPHGFDRRKPGSSDAALLAVLKHGLQHVNVPHSPGYQVTEDPTSHQLNSGLPSYFAPDPDPSIPTPKVPPTTDPKSQPSNGQVPLDLYLQQQAENLQVQHQQALDQSNTLTAQDLFNLLNYQPSTVNVIPQSQLQQHVLQPNVQFYNQPMLIPQTYQQENFQQFSPQYHTFNYDEQTQQGAYGSDSFPSASMNLQLLQPQSRNSIQESENTGTSFNSLKTLNDNEVGSSDKEESFDHFHQTHEINRRNQISIDSKHLDSKEIKSAYKTNTPSSLASYYTTLPNKKAANTLATLATAGSMNNVANTVDKTTETRKDRDDETEKENSSQDDNKEKPSENVQLQKSIQIYENLYPNHDMQTTKSDLPDYNEDYSSQENSGEYEKFRDFSETGKTTDLTSPNSFGFGVRLRPKRN